MLVTDVYEWFWHHALFCLDTQEALCVSHNKQEALHTNHQNDKSNFSRTCMAWLRFANCKLQIKHIPNYQGTFSELWLTFWQGSLKMFVQSYLVFNNILKTSTQKHYLYYVQGTFFWNVKCYFNVPIMFVKWSNWIFYLTFK